VLAEELHFGRAAARLHIAQPALSQQIKRLELQLGVRLVDRTRASVALSDAGAAVLAPARAAVQAADAAEEAARAFAAGERGELRLGLSPGAHYIAQPLLAELARRHPGVDVRAREASSGALTAAVAAGELELAVAFCGEPRPGVACEPLTDEPAVVAVADGHPLAGRESVSLADLRDERFALVDAADGPGYNRAVVELCRAAGFRPRTVGRRSGPMVWETAVRTGGCVGLTTRASAVSAARGVRLLALDPPARFPVQLMRPEADEAAWRPPARAFARLAREPAS
jgi:DNA-binding transcriptional LysR family regulator